ncbi:MAG: MarR family winged helix-turn-helix transcriptional regulator [Jatrophihabitans sp.]|uniref:MarR family winged helix-turn-helix transcriptional regulator n=1 Tax=Jatrophihabitans sp. TaxID=1932789 RepID=UPI0039134794
MPSGRAADSSVSTELIQEVMAASRLLVAVSVQSMQDLDPALTPIQVRTLLILASRDSIRPTELADALGVHASNATRACDKLVVAGRIQRQENPDNRRSQILRLTPAGRAAIRSISRRRARAIAKILEALPAERRRPVAAAMGEFAAAGGEAEDSALWASGWTT